MNKGDVLVERGARRLQALADRAAARGDGVGEWLSEELRNDAVFLRKLKPSLIAARARGNAPTNQAPAEPPPAPPPSPEQSASPKPKTKRSKPKRKGGGIPPVVVVAGALVAGVLLAKVVDWRGHAHPRD